MNEKQKLRKKVEVLARACNNYEQLVDKCRKTTNLDMFRILYEMGKYEMVIDGQKTLDEAIKVILKEKRETIDRKAN